MTTNILFVSFGLDVVSSLRVRDLAYCSDCVDLIAFFVDLITFFVDLITFIR